MNTERSLVTRPISRREMLKWVGASAAGAALAACAPMAQPQAPAAGGAAPASENVEITWLSHIYEPWNNALSAQAMAYMGLNPKVKIVYSYIAHADLNTKIVTSLAAGTPADIMGVYGPWMPQLVSNQWIDSAPDENVQDITDNFPAVMKESATYDGKVYGYVQHIGIPIPSSIRISMMRKA
jgi:ABC-type glycerol-3-phosphate transport system substrate-binding protein